MTYNFSRPQVLECPACGATLALPDSDTFLCDYCGKRIVVPPELRPHREDKAETVSIPYGAEEFTSSDEIDGNISEIDSSIAQKKSRMIITLSLSLGILLAGMVVFFVLAFNPETSLTDITSNELLPISTPIPTPTEYASAALVFGSEGSQPGQFDDARSIAIDNQGNIFVADYSSGRINKFDDQGNFLQLIQVGDPAANQDYYIPSIATDQTGYLYVTTGGQILKYDAATGELVKTFPDLWPEIYYESVIVAPDGNLYSTNGMAAADDVIILTTAGEVLENWTDLVESINHDDPAMSLALDVNSTGAVYLLSPFGNQVYRYNPDGTYHSSFGEEGDNPGQFSLSTDLIVVDSHDNLVICDAYRVDFFDENGNYLDKTFSIDYQMAGGAIYGMTIDATDNMYFITGGGKVLKFRVNYPNEND